MNIDEFAKMFPDKMEEITAFVQGDTIKDIIGTEAVNHFKQSFVNEGFTDKTLEKWPEVERRKPESAWYKKGADSARKILSGPVKELQDSLTFQYIADGVKISSPKIYAPVHQFGETANVFGKKPFTMKARPFIGHSEVMKVNIENEIQTEIKKIIS
ncbi:MAG: virion morphogenesis protein [Bacteroidia bacterium]|nr:virion morphogenesis protein [Bacteroidia bacterium]